MAIGSTVHRVSLTIANMDTHYYQSHELTVAQHPSETNLRFMVRLVAFTLNASDELSFTKGLSSDNEPDIWQKTLTDDIELWIDLGQPDEKRIRKACGRAKQVIIYTYYERKAQVWWEQNKSKLERYKNLKVVHINAEGIEAMVQKSIDLQCNIQDGELYLNDDDTSITVTVDSSSRHTE